MKRILELVFAVETKAFRKALRRESDSEQSLTWQLYEALRSGKFENEDEVAKKLYGKRADRQSPTYRALKSRLTHVLIETILEDKVEAPSYRNYDEAYQHGHRQLNVVRVLLNKKLFRSAREIASQTYRRVKDFQIVWLNLGLTDVLSGLHLGVNYNEKLFQKYHSLFVYYSDLSVKQNIVTDHYRQIRNHLYANRMSPSEIGAVAEAFSASDLSIRDAYPNVSIIQTMYAQTEITGLILRGDYNAAILCAERGLESLEQCKGSNITSKSMLSLSKIECTIKLGDFNRGRTQVEAGRDRVPKDTINELKIYEYAIRLGLRTGQYEYAYRELVAAQRSGLKKLLTPMHQQYWRIMEAYIQLLLLADELVVDPSWGEITSFRLSSFLNNVPAYVRNKKGTNIQILILQASILILQGKTDAMIDRTDALAAYCNRYLRDDDNLRNNAFFKLLGIIITTNFRREPAVRKAQKVLAAMRQAAEAGHQNDLELVPYEALWEVLLKHLR